MHKEIYSFKKGQRVPEFIYDCTTDEYVGVFGCNGKLSVIDSTIYIWPTDKYLDYMLTFERRPNSQEPKITRPDGLNGIVILFPRKGRRRLSALTQARPRLEDENIFIFSKTMPKTRIFSSVKTRPLEEFVEKVKQNNLSATLFD